MLSGHLQLDNCQFDQGQLHICSPGSVNIRYCTFNAAHVCFKGVGYSNISNCKFKPERVAVSIEEPSLSFKLRQVPAHIGGWIEMAHSSSIKEYYLNRLKHLSFKSKASQEFERQTDMSQESVNSYQNKIMNDSESGKVPGIETGRRRKSDMGSSSVLTDSFPVDCFDNDTKGILQSVRGVIITNNKIESGRGGVTISRMGHAWIEGNVITGPVYGVRCVQNSKVVILNNKIHSCETSAIFMREHSVGLIAGNHIFGNNEAGIDLRSNANPIIQHNHIYSGRRSGIVCLDNGRGLIRDNDIYNNKEAGVYILYKGNPDVK